MKKVRTMNLNEVSIFVLRELNVIRLYEQRYINQESFFDLVTGCGEQTEYEEGRDRLTYYLRLVANSENDDSVKKFDYFINQYHS